MVQVGFGVLLAFTKLLSEFHVVSVYAALFGLRHCVDALIEQYVNIEV